MLTKNYYNALKAQMELIMIPNALKTKDGNIVNAGSRSSGYMSNSRWMVLDVSSLYFQTSFDGFAIGSGTTPATEDDFKMENQITSGFSSPLGIRVDDGLHLFVNNTGSSNLSISEIGLYGNIPDSARASGGANYILLMHTVLETPIVLAPNETAEIIIKLDFELPEISA